MPGERRWTIMPVPCWKLTNCLKPGNLSGMNPSGQSSWNTRPCRLMMWLAAMYLYEAGMGKRLRTRCMWKWLNKRIHYNTKPQLRHYVDDFICNIVILLTFSKTYIQLYSKYPVYLQFRKHCFGTVHFRKPVLTILTSIQKIYQFVTNANQSLKNSP